MNYQSTRGKSGESLTSAQIIKQGLALDGGLFIPDEIPTVTLDEIKALGFKTVAMALKDNSLSISDKRLASENKLAVIMGTEGDGLSDKTIADCDFTVKIPMYHGVDSLNVAAASAVAFYQLGNKSN